MAKRFLTFDFLRGFAIMLIAVFHLLMLTCDLVTQAKVDPFSLPPIYLFITIFTVVFGHWRGLFLIISSVVHIYTMTVAIRKGVDRKLLWRQQVIFGLILWVFGMIREVFFNEWSIPQSLATGVSFGDALGRFWTWIYLIEALEAIAWGIILTSTVFYFLTANGEVEKTTRNALVFVVLAVIIIFITPQINQWSTAFYGQDTHNTSPESIVFLGWWDYITRLVTTVFIGYNSSLFPMLGYTFVGVAFGILLTRPIMPKHFLRNTALVGLGLSIFGIIWLIFIQGIPSDIGKLIDFQLHPTWYILLAIGMQLLFIVFFMRFIEFNPKINLERTIKITAPMRRWGVLALTIYSFLSLQYVIRWIMGLIFTQYDWMSMNTLPFAWSVLLIIVNLIVWGIILRLWAKINFKGSLEWILTKVGKRNKPGKETKAKEVLDIDGTFRNPEPLMFVAPIKEQKIKFTVLGQATKPN